MSLKQEAISIELEAIRRAVIHPDSFIDDKLRPAQKRDVRLMLARRYDKLIDQHKFDTHERLEDRIKTEYERDH